MPRNEETLYYWGDDPYESLAGTLIMRAVNNIVRGDRVTEERAFLYSYTGMLCLCMFCDDPEGFLRRIEKRLLPNAPPLK